MPASHICSYYTDEKGKEGCEIGYVYFNDKFNDLSWRLFEADIRHMRDHWQVLEWIDKDGRILVKLNKLNKDDDTKRYIYINKYCPQCGHSILMKPKRLIELLLKT